MQIIRGDDYQSWLYVNRDDLVVVDPWLTKKQVFPKLKWLLYRISTITPYLVKYNFIERVTHIIITAHFSDHLDVDSLNLFRKDIPIYTNHEASKVLVKHGFTNITIVKINEFYDLNSLKLKIYQAGKPYSSTSFAYSLSDGRSKIFHEPHMFNNKLKIDNVDVCIMTVDMVKVLGLIQVSMNQDQAKLAQSILQAKYLIPTGIAPSRTNGLITFLLNIKESYQTNQLMPLTCKEVGDSIIL